MLTMRPAGRRRINFRTVRVEGWVPFARVKNDFSIRLKRSVVAVLARIALRLKTKSSKATNNIHSFDFPLLREVQTKI